MSAQTTLDDVMKALAAMTIKLDQQSQTIAELEEKIKNKDTFVIKTDYQLLPSIHFDISKSLETKKAIIKSFKIDGDNILITATYSNSGMYSYMSSAFSSCYNQTYSVSCDEVQKHPLHYIKLAGNRCIKIEFGLISDGGYWTYVL